MMKKIRVNFTGLSIRSTFDPYNNPILDILKKHYEVEICDDPDYLICGVLYPGGYFSNGMFENFVNEPGCIRILLDGENYTPDFNLVDYAICQYPIYYLDRNFYLPCGVESFTSGNDSFVQLASKSRIYPSNFLKAKEYFASFIASHDSEYNLRGDFFKALNARKRVESAGSYLNNMPNGMTMNWTDGSKIDFLKKCKFSLCFESTKHEGFITEKIVEAFLADTIPVYYGSTNIKEIFNPKAFINISDFSSFDAAIDYILEIDQDDQMYMEMLSEPVFIDLQYPLKLMEQLEQFLCHIFDQPLEKAYRRSRYLAAEGHEKFIKRSIERARIMDIEGIEMIPRTSKKTFWSVFRKLIKGR
ncbi:MAG: glycosyltransferase family 10 domain-containing protein [Bacillus sp. (in: firmicutes)]